MNSNLVYQTIQLNCDKEYSAEPLDFTGIRTIKLTNKPTDIEVWISAENTGTNLFPLINRGDGWVNIEEPLQNVYIYTKGTNIGGEQLILNVTGQKDIFNYGNNSSERIDKVGLIEGFSPAAQMQLQNAIYNLWNPPRLVKTINLQGEFRTIKAGRTQGIVLPLPEKIKGLNLSDDKFYKLSFFGHIDNGTGLDDAEGTTRLVQAITTHFCLFNNTNNVEFTLDSTQDIDNYYTFKTKPWKSEKTDLFDIFGLKHASTGIPSVFHTLLQDYGLNFFDNNVFPGSIINQYENIGLTISTNSSEQNIRYDMYMHSSLLINLYEMQDPTQWQK